MRAALLSSFGPPENLRPAEVPDPVAGPGEVVVEVEVAGVMFVETQIRSGNNPFPEVPNPELPAILGSTVVGTVDGRRVAATLSDRGGYAERAVAPEANLIDLPDHVSALDAITATTEGRTALFALRAVEPRPGETVLVQAAAGGVGTLLVQLAVRAGCRVVALAGNTVVDGGQGTKLDVARALGADVALDVRDPAWVDAAGPVDVVFDAVQGEVGRASYGLLRPGGRFFSLGMTSGTPHGIDAGDAAARGITLPARQPFDAAARRAVSVDALALVAAGELRPVLAPVRPLEDAAGAHAAMEARTVAGKTVLQVR